MASKEEVRKLINDNIPGFDFSQQRSGLEMRSAAKVAGKLAKKKAVTTKLNDLDARGIVSGSTVSNSAGEREVVSSVSSNGYLVFKGRKGAFNPRYWELAK